jgi:hypothetical protein
MITINSYCCDKTFLKETQGDKYKKNFISMYRQFLPFANGGGDHQRTAWGFVASL